MLGAGPKQSSVLRAKISSFKTKENKIIRVIINRDVMKNRRIIIVLRNMKRTSDKILLKASIKFLYIFGLLFNSI